MEVKVKLRYLRIAPRKVRLVADQMRGETVPKTKGFLTFTPKRATDPLLKLLNSAVATAKNDYNLEESNLYVSEIRVDEGPKLKRWMPRARGSASPIQKKTSHVTIVLKEIKESKKSANKKEIKKPEAVLVEKVEEVKDLKMKVKPRREKKESVKMTTQDTSNKKIFRRKSI